ncbi:MAG: transketolase [candidate division Zixibacteria bacterium]|nr:transketolase [Candidatus Tariuqbacter arcticus]
MALIDSKTGKIRKTYSLEELKEAANYMRGLNLVSLRAAGSGHAGGTMSMMDFTAALYLHAANLDPENPDWDDRDRIIWSVGHKAPNLYLGLGMAGYFDVEDVVRLRKLYSPYQGHPHWLKLKGVEASTGSLGQGMSIAIGIALAAKLDEKDFQVYSLHGDGELQEGQIWEAAMEAGHFKLNNLTAIVDMNRLQIDGWVKDVMNIEPLREKFQAFGWNTIEIDGHDMLQIMEALDIARQYRGKPTVIIANTVKGKGVSFMENIAGWHGRAPKQQELEDALKELNLEDKFDVPRLLKIADDYQVEAMEILEAKQPKFSRDYWWNHQDIMKAEMDPTRWGLGRMLKDKGDDERIICIGMDISGSITINHFLDEHPERKPRFISVGIAEQSGTNVAAGLAKEGKLPVFGTYGVFSSGRNLDQLRTTVSYGELNVFVIGAHGGVSVGADGATHQALEELFQLTGLPNMTVAVPCDVNETYRMAEYLLFEHKGPKFIRYAREATPVVTDDNTPFEFGKATVIRFRGEADNFKDAFEWKLASEYENENEDISLIACGPMVPEAMRAAWILKNDFNIETRILNVHTVKPLDIEAIVKAAEESSVIVTAEEHQVGGFGNWIASAIMKSGLNNQVLFDMIGVLDRFGESGAPWELIKEFEVSGEHIAAAAKGLWDKK